MADAVYVRYMCFRVEPKVKDNVFIKRFVQDLDFDREIYELKFFAYIKGQYYFYQCIYLIVLNNGHNLVYLFV